MPSARSSFIHLQVINTGDPSEEGHREDAPEEVVGTEHQHTVTLLYVILGFRVVM